MSDLNMADKALEVAKEISKAGNTLLGMFNEFYVEPAAIRKNALAKADAYKIIQVAEEEVFLAKERLLKDGLIRKLNEFAIQEANLRTILDRAAHLLPDNSEPKEPSPDWKSSFVRHAENVSDEDMRDLWANILTAEATTPGSFSKRTMNAVAELSKEEAELFATVCRYFLKGLGPVILNFDDPIYSTNGLNYGSLSRLAASGLIVLAANFDHAITGLTPSFGTVYFDQMLHLGKTGGTLGLGKIAFSPIGWELSRIVKVEAVPVFFEYLVNKWFAFGPSYSPPNSLSSDVINSILAREPAPQPTIEPGYAKFGS